MKRLLLILVIALAWGGGDTNAQTDGVAAIQVGSLIQSGTKSALAYGIAADIPTRTILDGIVTKVEVTALYSDKNLDYASETYAGRTLAVRQIQIGDAYVGLGAGAWVIIDTDGSDHSHVAFRLEVGTTWKGLELYLGGDVVDVRDGPDMYFPHASVSVIGF